MLFNLPYFYIPFFYLLGAFPTGRLIARAHGVEISAHGSGNVGATNVGRIIGKKAGLLTLIGDVAKGCLAVTLAAIVISTPSAPAIAAVLVVLGHCFSIPPLLKGGKGVATGLGAITALAPTASLVSLMIFILIYLRTKIVSLSALCAALVAPLAALLLQISDDRSYALMVIALIIITRHKDNIRRLIEGSEPRTTFK